MDQVAMRCLEVLRIGRESDGEDELGKWNGDLVELARGCEAYNKD